MYGKGSETFSYSTRQIRQPIRNGLSAPVGFAKLGACQPYVCSSLSRPWLLRLLRTGSG